MAQVGHARRRNFDSLIVHLLSANTAYVLIPVAVKDKFFTYTLFHENTPRNSTLFQESFCQADKKSILSPQKNPPLPYHLPTYTQAPPNYPVTIPAGLPTEKKCGLSGFVASFCGKTGTACWDTLINTHQTSYHPPSRHPAELHINPCFSGRRFLRRNHEKIRN